MVPVPRLVWVSALAQCLTNGEFRLLWVVGWVQYACTGTMKTGLKILAVEMIRDPAVGASQDGIDHARHQKFVADGPVTLVGGL